MLDRRTLIAASLASALSACGGSSASATTVNVYGDSLTAGVGLELKPVVYMQQVLGSSAVLRDYSAPSMRTRDALYGNPAQPYTTLLDSVQTTKPDIVVLAYGGSDIFTPSLRFYTELHELVLMCKSSKVVLVTFLNYPFLQKEISSVNEVITTIAAETGATLVDAYSLPFGGLVDEVHPNQEYSLARADLIAKAIVTLM